MRAGSRPERGFVLLQVLVVLVLLSAWAALALAQALAVTRRAQMASEAVRLRLALSRGMEQVWEPPALSLLCLASPHLPQQRVLGESTGVWSASRWRHVGSGVILAELEAVAPTGGRARVIAWLVPDTLERRLTGVGCPGHSVRPLASGAIIPRPGE